MDIFSHPTHPMHLSSRHASYCGFAGLCVVPMAMHPQSLITNSRVQLCGARHEKIAYAKAIQTKNADH